MDAQRNGDAKAPYFTDAKSRKWLVILTAGNTQSVIDAEGVDLGDLDKFAELYGVATNRRKFSRVLWLLCRRQADTAAEPIDAEDFADALDGDALCGAWEALVDAILNFTEPELRPALEKIMEKEGAARLLGIQAMIREMDSEEVNQYIDDTIKAGMMKAKNDIIGN